MRICECLDAPSRISSSLCLIRRDRRINGLKDNLEVLLTFAGLFAGVNSAFLALMLPGMSPNPSDDTNALLVLLVQGQTVSGDDIKLPSSSFTPSIQDRAINVLFSLSLSTALMAAFFAVLGRQWLVYYQKRT
ncbi:hypothetical protein M407DRAFT_69909, partial [Tulasnella calospora MUT 4182]